jgi:hypothetical protein
MILAGSLTSIRRGIAGDCHVRVLRPRSTSSAVMSSTLLTLRAAAYA